MRTPSTVRKLSSGIVVLGMTSSSMAARAFAPVMTLVRGGGHARSCGPPSMVEGRAGDRGVDHQMDRERGDVGRTDDATDRQFRPQLLPPRLELVAQQRRGQ